MMRARFVTSLVAAAALGMTPAARAESVALTGGIVHTMVTAPIDHCTVIITDGKIAACSVGAPVPADARVIDCRGKHVYPGFVSANTVLGLTEIGSVRGTVDDTETGTVNPNIRAEVEINPESDLIPVTRVNGVTSALVIPRGGALSGLSALIHLDGWTYEDMTIAAPVGLHVQWPNMDINRAWWETRSEEDQRKARDEAVSAIRAAFDDARAYWTAHVAATTAGAGIPRHDRDVKWDAMRKVLRGEIPVFFHANSFAQIRAVLRFIDDQKLARAVLVGGDDAPLLARELVERRIPVICDPTLAMPRRGDDPYDAAFTLPARLREAGVVFCISDGGGASNARNLPYHAAMAAAYGLPPEEAVKAITLSPAQILGVDKMIGSIEPGKVADVFVADGDALEIATQVERVFITGKEVSMETRQTRLFQKYDARPRGPKARVR